MNKHEIAAQWQTALREIFPGVDVWHYGEISKDDEVITLDVFNVPDESRRAFVKFLIKDYANFRKNRGLVDVDLIPHTVTDTRDYYPDVWRNGAAYGVAMTQKGRLENLRFEVPVAQSSSTRMPSGIFATFKRIFVKADTTAVEQKQWSNLAESTKGTTVTIETPQSTDATAAITSEQVLAA